MTPRQRPHEQQGSDSVRVPAEVARPDPIIFGLTAKQAALAASLLGGLWAVWQATRGWLAPPVFCAVAGPVATAAITVLTVRRGGRGLEEVLLDWWRHYRSPKRLVPADGPAAEATAPVPEWVDVPQQPLPAPLRLPASAISETGVVDLGEHGLARPMAASTVNFGLRTPAEQKALLGGFARWLHALSTRVQIVARAEPLDLTGVTHRLRTGAGSLPHPKLEQACRSHAAFLDSLADTRQPLRRRMTVVLTAPAAEQATELAHRGDDTARALNGCEVTLTPLSGAQATALLRAAADPHQSRTPTGGNAAAVVHGSAGLLGPHPEADEPVSGDAEVVLPSVPDEWERN